ncbi:hypothetical protein [Lacticaseibacillus sp. GG6-2]
MLQTHFIPTLGAAIKLSQALTEVDPTLQVEFAPAYRNRRGREYPANVAVWWQKEPRALVWQAHSDDDFDRWDLRVPNALHQRVIATVDAQPQPDELFEVTAVTGKAGMPVMVVAENQAQLEAQIERDQKALAAKAQSVALEEIITTQELRYWLWTQATGDREEFEPVVTLTHGADTEPRFDRFKMVKAKGVVPVRRQSLNDIDVLPGAPYLDLTNELGLRAILAYLPRRHAWVLQLSPAANLFAWLQKETAGQPQYEVRYRAFADGAVRVLDEEDD